MKAYDLIFITLLVTISSCIFMVKLNLIEENLTTKIENLQ